MVKRTITRRDLLRTGALSAAGLALGRAANVPARAENALISKPIPSSGEALPAIGIGTNRFGTDDPEALGAIRNMLMKLPELGGKVIDTAHSYGSSEAVIGRLTEEIGNRDALFIATKAPGRGAVSRADIDSAFQRLRTGRLDLLQVHNFNRTDEVMPMLLDLKAEGRVRYVGCSTSRDSQYGDMKRALARYALDFIQVDYSIDNRSAAGEILPMAADHGVAVLVNVPFGGRRNAASNFSRVAEVSLPDWAAGIQVASWAQYFLKYVVSHPAVTAAIPGTTKLRHLTDNLGAARGSLPDDAMRREMEGYWDALN